MSLPNCEIDLNELEKRVENLVLLLKKIWPNLSVTFCPLAWTEEEIGFNVVFTKNEFGHPSAIEIVNSVTALFRAFCVRSEWDDVHVIKCVEPEDSRVHQVCFGLNIKRVYPRIPLVMLVDTT